VIDDFLDALRASLGDGSLVKLTLGGPCGPDATLRNVHGRPVALSAGPRLQLVYRHATRDVTTNLEHDEGVARVAALLDGHFRSAHLYTTERSLQLDRTKRSWRMSQGPAQHGGASTSHDREKQRPVELDPAWLDALGTSPRKRKQILRFTEVLDHLLADAERPEDGRLRLVDMGCGKGYLTFAAWQTLRARGWPHAEVVGVELRPELARASEALARRLGYDGLGFRAGTIADTPLQGADVVVALHACDTATDDALAAGVEAGARWLVVAPCCHKEVRPQLEGPSALRPAWRHGILRTREAEIATDALRAALLEAAGYRSKVFEFTSTEHTDKNLMITAVKRGDAPSAAADRARELASFYGIARQRLAERLGLDLTTTTAEGTSDSRTRRSSSP
jgi:SAM-dependent methyltransferase